MSVTLAIPHGANALSLPRTGSSLWRRRLLGFFLVFHALAHSSAIVWATATAPAWFVSVLWIAALIGYLSAGLGILGMPTVFARWPWMFGAATIASITLLALSGDGLASVGIFIDLMLIPGVVRWGHVPRDVRGNHWIATTAGVLVLGWVTVVALGRPVYVHWGTTAAERAAPLFGDNGQSGGLYRVDHAVTIRAPVDSVWPWLVQLGQDRAGFYSYDWLERLAGDNVHNAERIHPEWQRLEAGDFVRAAQPDYLGGRLGDLGWRVKSVLPGRAFVLENWGAFVLQPVDSDTTRFFVRTRGEGVATLAGVVLGPISTFMFEPAHFIMQRRMMLGIRERAERLMGG